MEPVVELAKLLMEGGPWAVAAVALAAWAYERRENKNLQKSILELATAQTESALKQGTAVETLREMLTVFIQRRR